MNTGTRPAIAEAAVSDWQQGASIYPHNPSDFSSDSFKQSMQDLKGTGADTAVLIVPIYQDNDQASEMKPGGDTPTDDSLIAALDYLQSIGMKAVLKPHLGSYSGNWRAYINASDRDAWFRNYGAYLNHLGDIGQAHGADGMVVGTELISMAAETVNADNTQRWNTLIADLRQHFSGFLTYSANWSWNNDHFEGEVKHIGFWPALDYIGISAYYPLADNQNDPSVDALVGSWGYWDDSQVRDLSEQYGKPVIFTEIGYTSIDGAHKAPCCTWWGSYDGTEQANDYEALFRYWDGKSYMDGVYLWNWDTDPNYGGSGNTDYSPQNKPAEEIMKDWFSGSPSVPPDDGGGNGGTGGDTGGGTDTGGDAGGGDGGTGSDVSGEFTVTGSAPDFEPGQAGTMHVSVGSAGGATNIIVDIEVYDASTRQVLQRFYEHQDIGAGSSKGYDITWSPPSAGVYVLKTGVFDSSWDTLYTWNDEVARVSVGGADTGGGTGGGSGDAGGEPTGPAATNLWWPTNGAKIAGNQPFKAMLEDARPLSSYRMYWQVDGGELHELGDSDQDYPHKESWVDVSAWPRKDESQPEDRYSLTFIAKGASGEVVSEKTIEVIVGR